MKKRKWTDEQLIEATKNSVTVSDVIKKLRLAVAGGTYSYIQKHMERLGVSFVTTAKERQLSGIKQHQYSQRYNDGDVFKLDSNVSSAQVRTRYIAGRKKPYECDLCNTSQWQNQQLSLHLDHINGNRYDHRKCNLRLLCPNCHSLTETYAGKGRSTGM